MSYRATPDGSGGFRLNPETDWGCLPLVGVLLLLGFVWVRDHPDSFVLGLGVVLGGAIIVKVVFTIGYAFEGRFGRLAIFLKYFLLIGFIGFLAVMMIMSSKAATSTLGISSTQTQQNNSNATITGLVKPNTLKLRAGAGLNSARLDGLAQGTVLLIIGRNVSGDWLKVRVRNPAEEGWVAAEYVEVKGSLDALPIVTQ